MNLFSAWNLPWPVLQIPEYREITREGWTLKRLGITPQFGYFQDWQGAGERVVLTEGEQVWMSTDWSEVDSQAPHVAAGHGHVVVMGAGMGIALFNLLLKPEVQQVTLVERDPRVLEMLEQAAGLRTWPGHEKLRVALVDALDFSPDQPVDHLYVDIWLTTGERQAVAEMQAIQRRVKAASVGWWGQEICFLAWLKCRGMEPSLSSYDAWAEELGLPLIGRGDPAYIAGVMQVTKSFSYRCFLADPRRSGTQSRSETMLENWTHPAFSQHIHTAFHMEHPEWGIVPLELVSVSELRETPRQRMYSILFRGPLEMPFQQGSFPLKHEVMGTETLFLVPVAREEDGFRYEAVFNLLIK